VGRRRFLVGAGTAAAAVGLAGYEGRARASSAAAAQGVGGGPETTRSISPFATPLQNQFAAWAFEYVAEGADVGEIEAIANDMASNDDDAYYEAWYGHAKRHRAKADEARRRGRDHTARYHYRRATVYASVSYKLLFGKPVDADLANMQAAIDANQRLRWVFLQRGFLVNGATNLREWLQKVALFTLEGRSDRIRCPVLGTFADRDPLAGNAKETLSRLKASTTLMTFTAAEGAGAHQETRPDRRGQEALVRSTRRPASSRLT
jgi:hypothetical protein